MESMNHTISKFCRYTALVAGLSILCMETAEAADSNETLQKTVKVLGKPTGAQLLAKTNQAGNAIGALANFNVFGVILQAIMAWQGAPNTINGKSYTEVFVFGKRVFSQTEYVHNNLEKLQFNVGLAPTEMRIPVLTYPVGPILLRLDAGARVLADLSAQVTPNFGIPLFISTVGLTMGARLDGAAFAEGYAQAFVVRAGVGGQVDLIDAHADLNAQISFDGSKPVVLFNAMAQFLKGRLYAFLDVFTFIPWEFKRLVDLELYTWPGFCAATGTASCPNR